MPRPRAERIRLGYILGVGHEDRWTSTNHGRYFNGDVDFCIKGATTSALFIHLSSAINAFKIIRATIIFDASRPYGSRKYA